MKLKFLALLLFLSIQANARIQNTLTYLPISKNTIYEVDLIKVLDNEHIEIKFKYGLKLHTENKSFIVKLALIDSPEKISQKEMANLSYLKLKKILKTQNKIKAKFYRNSFEQNELEAEVFIENQFGLKNINLELVESGYSFPYIKASNLLEAPKYIRAHYKALRDKRGLYSLEQELVYPHISRLKKTGKFDTPWIANLLTKEIFPSEKASLVPEELRVFIRNKKDLQTLNQVNFY